MHPTHLLVQYSYLHNIARRRKHGSSRLDRSFGPKAETLLLLQYCRFPVVPGSFYLVPGMSHVLRRRTSIRCLHREGVLEGARAKFHTGQSPSLRVVCGDLAPGRVHKLEAVAKTQMNATGWTRRRGGRDGAVHTHGENKDTQTALDPCTGFNYIIYPNRFTARIMTTCCCVKNANICIYDWLGKKRGQRA